MVNATLRISPERTDKYTFEQTDIWMDQQIRARSTQKCYWEKKRISFLSILHSLNLLCLPLGYLSVMIQTSALSILEVPYSHSVMSLLPYMSAWHFIAHLNFHPPVFSIIVPINCIYMLAIHDEVGQKASSNNESGPHRALKIRTEAWTPRFIPDVTQQGVWKRWVRHSRRPALPHCARLSSKTTATVFLEMSCLTVGYDFKHPDS